MVSARSTAPTVFLLEAGEPLAASQCPREKLCVILCAKAWMRGHGARSGGRNGESLTFESRQILRVPMTTSWLQRLVRGISLLAAWPSTKSSSDGGGRSATKVASSFGWPVKRDELGLRDG
jgi:hypothetical protein